MDAHRGFTTLKSAAAAGVADLPHPEPAVLIVTHDVEEAIALADRVLVLDKGRIVAQERITAPRGERSGLSARLREKLLSYLGGDDHGTGVLSFELVAGAVE